MKSKTTVFILLIQLLLLFGYCRGIYKLIKCDFEPSYKAEIIYSVGAITGLNCIIGYFDLGK